MKNNWILHTSDLFVIAEHGRLGDRVDAIGTLPAVPPSVLSCLGVLGVLGVALGVRERLVWSPESRCSPQSTDALSGNA